MRPACFHPSCWDTPKRVPEVKFYPFRFPQFTWSNEDEAVHTVTAADKSWDSGRLPLGATFSQTFSQAGTYEFVCSIHAAMKGTITVT